MSGCKKKLVIHKTTNYMIPSVSVSIKKFSNMYRIHNMKKVMEYVDVLSIYFRVRQDVSDEILTSIYFIKYELQTSIKTMLVEY